MTREEFVARNFHELYGMIADAVVRNGRGDGELSMFLALMRDKINIRLARMYDSLKPPEPPVVAKPNANGQQQRPARV